MDDIQDAAAYQEIQSIRADSTHPYNNPQTREHEPARAHVRQLYMRAYGTDPIGPETQPRLMADPAHPITTVEDPRHGQALADAAALHGADAEPPAPAHPEAPAAPLPFALPALPDGERWHEPTVRAFHASATALGVSDAETAAWLNAYAQPAADAPDPSETARTLKQEWGAAYEANLRAARLALERFPVRVQHTVETTDLGNDPRLLRRLAELGRPLLRVTEEIARIRRDAAHPYNNPNHPRHAAEREKVRALYVTVYGERPLP
jgi:hypothetical protein